MPQATSNSQDSLRSGLEGSHHLPPCSILYTTPWEWHLNGFLSRDSQVGVPKSPRLGVLQLCGTITSCADFRSGRGLNQSCSPCRELSNEVLYVTYTQGNRVDSQLPMVGNQTASLTPGLSFGHNLCYNVQMGHASPFWTSTLQ